MNYGFVEAGIHCRFALLTQSLRVIYNILFCTTTSAISALRKEEEGKKRRIEEESSRVSTVTQPSSQNFSLCPALWFQDEGT